MDPPQALGLGAIVFRGGERRWSDDSSCEAKTGEVILRFSLELPRDSAPSSDGLIELQNEIKSITQFMIDLDRDPRKIAKDVLRAIWRFDPNISDIPTSFWTMQYLAAKARYALENIPEERKDLRRRLNYGIQRLTFWATNSQVGFVEGLKLGENKSWTNLMYFAQEELRRIEARRIQEFNPLRTDNKRRKKPVPEARAEIDYLDVPQLLDRIREGGKILIIGGVPKPRKIEWLRAKIEGQPEIEWPDVAGKTASRRLPAFEEQIRQGSVACVLLVNGIVSHQTSDRIVLSCRTSQTPFGVVGKAGLESLREALIKIDKSLSS
ncbi:MAG: hypothetical protein ABIB04_04860 [Patescibacteria group bacterium]